MCSSVENWEAQLVAVKEALLLASDREDERAELESLKSSLEELLELTKETQIQQTKASETTASKEDSIGDEMQRFLSELNETEASVNVNKARQPTAPKADETNSEQQLQVQLEQLKKQLEELVGEKCSAPHRHSWGAVTYHNAIICGVPDTLEVGDDDNLEARVRVLFTNPTHREMLPCSYYLEGECRFDEDRCHYSHGELVLASDLRAYKEPNFAQLGKDCVVLAKMHDRLWHQGRVVHADFDSRTCRVRLNSKGPHERESDIAFEDLLPIYQDGNLSSGSSSDNDDKYDSIEESSNSGEEFPIRFVDQSLPPFQVLGEWEKHTKGIGSKLMAKMGYVLGSGLGSEGRGIVTPLSAQILPQGCSLDHCMKLREAANGDKDLFSIERKLLKEKKKQEALNARRNRVGSDSDVFSLINQMCSGSSGSKHSKGGEQKRLEEGKTLNAQLVSIADDIKRKRREILRVEESIKRNARSDDMLKRLRIQLHCRNEELRELQTKEKALSNEQSAKKKKDEFYSF